MFKETKSEKLPASNHGNKGASRAQRGRDHEGINVSPRSNRESRNIATSEQEEDEEEGIEEGGAREEKATREEGAGRRRRTTLQSSNNTNSVVGGGL